MYIKVSHTKYKKKNYVYVRIMDREYQAKTWKKQDHVVANLGTVEEVKPHIDTLVKGLERVKSL